MNKVTELGSVMLNGDNFLDVFTCNSFYMNDVNRFRI